MAEAAPLIDLPYLKVDTSHLITEDDTPLDSPFQERQQAILTDALYASWKPGRKFLSLRNVGVFGSIRQPAIVPDVLLTLDVDLLPCEESRAYFVWEYGKPPDLVIKIVSKEPGGEGTTKLEKYAGIGVPYYVIYNPFGFRGERILKAYQRQGLGYIDVVNPNYLPELGLGLATWEGTYQGCPGKFLRFVHPDGTLMWTAEEFAAQSHQRADDEQRRADEERQRADEEHRRAERLAKKLQELGIDLESL